MRLMLVLFMCLAGSVVNASQDTLEIFFSKLDGDWERVSSNSYSILANGVADEIWVGTEGATAVRKENGIWRFHEDFCGKPLNGSGKQCGNALEQFSIENGTFYFLDL